MLQIGSSNLGQIPSAGTPVRWDYIAVSETQYIGFGSATTTDSSVIIIKKNVRNPSTGVITTTYALDTWTNHLTATYA